jgi:hypothetical protein
MPQITSQRSNFQKSGAFSSAHDSLHSNKRETKIHEIMVYSNLDLEKWNQRTNKSTTKIPTRDFGLPMQLKRNESKSVTNDETISSRGTNILPGGGKGPFIYLKDRANDTMDYVFFQFSNIEEEKNFQGFMESKLKRRVTLSFGMSFVYSVINAAANVLEAQSFQDWREDTLHIFISCLYAVAIITVCIRDWKRGMLERVVFALSAVLVSMMATWELFLQVTHPEDIDAHEVCVSGSFCEICSHERKKHVALYGSDAEKCL